MFKIAIDGFMGSGKSTLAKGLAEKLGKEFKVLDTGAIFRAIAYAYSVSFGSEVTEDRAKELVSTKTIEVRFVGDEQNVFVNQENVTPFLRTENISQMASKISVFPAVRAKYLEIAKGFASRNNVIMEGRDIGTVVMPDANVKIFLTADENVRAKRRFDEAKARGQKVKLKEILKDLKERDKRDTTRSVAPLKPMKDSVIVDNTEMSLEETIEFCHQIVLKKMEKSCVNIAIDGYVCSGKSTIAKELARRLKFNFFDTGAVYRGIACAFKYLGLDEGKIDEKYVQKFSKQIFVEIKFVRQVQRVYVNGVDHTKDLRRDDVTALTAKLSPFMPLREKVLKIQRDFASGHNVVMEGRDIGSEVLPGADFKFFTIADENVRAERRYKQFLEKGEDVTYEKVLAEVKDRDYKDIHRSHGAIKMMPDAHLIDTTNQTLDESVEECLSVILKKKKLPYIK